MAFYHMYLLAAKEIKLERFGMAYLGKRVESISRINS